MKRKNNLIRKCAICGKSFSPQNVVSGEIIRKEIATEIQKTYPNWSADEFICRADLAKFERELCSLLARV